MKREEMFFYESNIYLSYRIVVILLPLRLFIIAHQYVAPDLKYSLFLVSDSRRTSYEEYIDTTGIK